MKLLAVVSDYYATGEGRTISILVTKAYPKFGRDYLREPTYDSNMGKYDPGELKHTPEQIAVLEFTSLFGGYLAIGLEVLTIDQLIKEYADYIPKIVIKTLTKTYNENNEPGNFCWYAQMHINFS